MFTQRFTRFDDAKKAAKSHPGSTLRREGNNGWILTVSDNAVHVNQGSVSSGKQKKSLQSGSKVSSAVGRPMDNGNPQSPTCVSCGKIIPLERIKAIPNALRCIDCQNELERGRLKPGDNLGLCPRCGSPLVWRQGALPSKTNKYFVGCSGFPKCRYTQNC